MGVEHMYWVTSTFICDSCGKKEVLDERSQKKMGYPEGWISALVFLVRPSYPPYIAEPHGFAEKEPRPKRWAVEGIDEKDAKFCLYCDKCSKNVLPEELF